jgi:putative DNA-invertase from lambdoid prophage Rac
LIEETVSGSSAAGQRDGFKRLIDRLESGDMLGIGKLDCLGRDVVYVVTTVNKLAAIGVKVHCLQLGGTDLTSPAGRMTMNVLAAVAQFERDLLIERTQSGLSGRGRKARKSGRAPHTERGSARRGAGGAGSRRKCIGAGAQVRNQPADDLEGESNERGAR